MAKGRSIREFLEEGKPLFSVEFFPPRDEAGGERILATAKSLAPHQPDFVSITYGAGGGTRATTMRYARILREEHGFEVMPHLTCVGHTRDELLEILDDFAEAGFCNVMALRGDPPKGETEFKTVPGGLRYGSDLVALVRERFPHFGIGVGGYPEKHPEAPDMATDLSHLKTKVDAGADFITTQLFFDNRDYLDFVAACRAMFKVPQPTVGREGEVDRVVEPLELGHPAALSQRPHPHRVGLAVSDEGAVRPTMEINRSGALPPIPTHMRLALRAAAEHSLLRLFQPMQVLNAPCR